MTRADLTAFGYAVPLAFLAAAGLVLLVWISADEAVAVRIFAAATLPLWSFDVVESYQLTARGRGVWSPERMASALHVGVSTATAIVLVLGASAPVAAAAGGVGAAFGSWVWPVPTGRLARAAARYDTDRPIPRAWLGWPALVALLLAGVLAYPPEGGWPGYLYFQPVLLLGIGATYTAHRSVPLALHPMTAKLCGAALLFATIAAAYMVR
ncbi:hypothetical protein [Roseivivax sediminis]|uniref:Uncharacterized protein n=1 Tax=Roseivivax sediminis TaxID=936889 RepID=A0A1I1W8Q8_9RHOB|nr:hypothetical protein [Roseivivax sediminis]SFD91586.1 hypothetical protein SAMN04515678_104192 [Roseivivax sediminis]